MIAPDRLITLVFWVAVIIPPPHEPVKPLGVAMTRVPAEDGFPVGRLSVNATPVRGARLLLAMMKERVEVVPSGILEGVNIFEIIGGPKTTMLAVAVSPVPP